MRTQSKKRTQWIVGGLALCLAIVCLSWFYGKLTDDFRLANITHPMPYQTDWEIATSTEQQQHVNEILAQTFYYLGKGSQSYAFLSADGQYVLKFFKFKHLKNSFVSEQLAALGLFTNYYAKQTARKQRKLWGVFRSYKLAYEVHRHDSGLVYMQLNARENPSRHVTIIDKIGKTHALNLQDYPFVLQLKADTLSQKFKEFLAQGRLEPVQEHISHVFDLYAEEYAKGIYDRDHAVMRNVGFVDGQIIHLDVGKLASKPEMKEKTYAKADAMLVANKMKHWIKQHDPAVNAQLSAYIDHKISTLYD